MPSPNKAKSATGQPKPKPGSAVSVKSTSSSGSVESIGIGAVSRQPPVDAYLRFRLMPEGLGTNGLNVYDQHFFDCLVFVIYCEKHGTVALSNPSDWTRMYSYFPFIPLQDAFPWSRTSHDGLAIILGKSDSANIGDGDGDPITQLPKYTESWLNITRVQLPRNVKYFTRLTQLVRLKASDSGDQETIKCCQNNQRIRWLKLSDICQDGKVDNLWGAEVARFCRAMRSAERVILTEIDIKMVMDIFGEAETKLLQQIEWTEKCIAELMLDYAHHMYPAFNMTVNSFRCFLAKYSLLAKDDKRIGRLFKVLAAGGEGVPFSHFVIGLACMDPKASNELDSRAKFIFSYYDPSNKGLLTTSYARELLRDLDSSLSENTVKSKVHQLMKSFGSGNGTLTLAEFTDALRCENDFPNGYQLLRLEKSYFEAKKARNKSASLRAKQTEETQKSSSSETKSMSPAPQSACFSHAAKKFDYGLHVVTLDSTGRCVDPRIICEQWLSQWKKHEMTRNRFSVENVFNVHAEANVFLDLMRAFKDLDLENNRGLFAGEEEALFGYVEMLSRQVEAIVRHEPKLLRLASPVVVFGDLQGSMIDLLQFESHLFRATPVTGHTLLFLGNYSGPSFRNGFECITYLFALKILMPNKIYLLRGRNEMRQFNKFHLRAELLAKYGDEFGEKILERFNRVFDCLPVAAIVSETILCTHSGIPQLPANRKLLRAFEADYSTQTEFAEPKEEIPIGYEMMVNVPVRYAHDKEEEAETNRCGFGVAKAGSYGYFSRKSFEAFLKTNSFDYLLRSHNPCDDGYALCFSNRCLTIHSCRRCNATPMAFTAFALIDDSKRKIRVVRFETSLKTRA